MALALNIFKTIATTVTTSQISVYNAPVGYSGVVLLAQVTNVTNNTEFVSVWHRRTVNNSPFDVQMLKDYPIPSNEVLNLFSGKLILESGDSIVIEGTATSVLNLVISVLETLN